MQGVGEGLRVSHGRQQWQNTTAESPFRAQTDMTFWAKSLRVFHCLWEHGTQSVRRIAHKTGFSKSSVHRLQQAIARRGRHPESWLWETEDGRQWLTRLMVATLYTL